MGIPKSAVKSYLKLLDAQMEALSAYADCDRQYDAGEWSGPSWGDIYISTEATVADKVAQKYGVEADDILAAAEEYLRDLEENARDAFYS
jgi:hypothetical protein